MNYLSELLAFDNWQPDNLQDASAISIWYALMRAANNCGWPDWFTLPIKTLEVKTGLSRSAVYNGLHKLEQLGRIEKRKRAGRQCAIYRLCPLCERDTDTKLNATRTQSGTQREHKAAPLTKPKEKPKREEDPRVREDDFGNPLQDPAWEKVAACYLDQIGMLRGGVSEQDLMDYTDRMGADAVCVAIEETNRKGSDHPLPLLLAILRDWDAKGVRTQEQALAVLRERAKPKGRSSLPVAEAESPYKQNIL